MANLEHAEDEAKHEKMACQVSAVGDSVPVKQEAAPVGVLCALPSFSAAAQLLSAPYSCLVLSARRRHIVLPPGFMHKKRTGIREELEAELLRFSPSLNGVPLAYDDVKIMGPHGDIYDDSGYIHMNIEANFIIFQPKKGQRLLGQVNKLGVAHAGCVVHGCFNASIPRPNLVSVEMWRDAGPRIGSEIEFEVTALDADAVGVLLVRGRLSKTRVQELLAQCENAESGVTIEAEPDDSKPTPEPTPEEPEEPDDTVKKKKKKKKKDKIKEEEIEEEVTRTPETEPDISSTMEPNGTTEENHGSEGEETRKKKKKKKEKRVKDEREETYCIQIHCSDSSGYISDKASRKRKHDNDNNDISSLGEEETPTKSKKKRKKDI